MTMASADRNSIFMLRLRILVLLASLWIVGIVAATLIFSSLRGKLQYPQVLSHLTSEMMCAGMGFSCVISSGTNFKHIYIFFITFFLSIIVKRVMALHAHLNRSFQVYYLNWPTRKEARFAEMGICIC